MKKQNELIRAYYVSPYGGAPRLALETELDGMAGQCGWGLHFFEDEKQAQELADATDQHYERAKASISCPASRARYALGRKTLVYAVDVYVAQDEMMDWDTPIGAQGAKIRRAIRKLGLTEHYAVNSGRAAYYAYALRQGLKLPKARCMMWTARAFDAQGIKGFKCLSDYGLSTQSRYYQYVIFDPSRVRFA